MVTWGYEPKRDTYLGSVDESYNRHNESVTMEKNEMVEENCVLKSEIEARVVQCGHNLMNPFPQPEKITEFSGENLQLSNTEEAEKNHTPRTKALEWRNARHDDGKRGMFQSAVQRRNVLRFESGGGKSVEVKNLFSTSWAPSL
ncbi:hypothetical protein V8G54_028708 [Vigna mungo]|uniref:Uncharacterized protein n=1 Tax=Vigna mungo TaxID=3915 RepID=A0AAQ3MSH3_VIGMU